MRPPRDVFMETACPAHLFVSLLLLICIVLQSPFKSPSILSELSEVKTSRTESFLLFSGWDLGSQLPPPQASRERGLQTPFPTRRCQARAVDSEDPTVGNCSQSAKSPPRPVREARSVHSTCVLTRDWSKEGTDRVVCQSVTVPGTVAVPPSSALLGL